MLHACLYLLPPSLLGLTAGYGSAPPDAQEPCFACLLTWPQLHTARLFSKRDHINTLAPLGADQLWGVLHNLGKVRKLQ